MEDEPMDKLLAVCERRVVDIAVLQLFVQANAADGVRCETARLNPWNSVLLKQDSHLLQIRVVLLSRVRGNCLRPFFHELVFFLKHSGVVLWEHEAVKVEHVGRQVSSNSCQGPEGTVDELKNLASRQCETLRRREDNDNPPARRRQQHLMCGHG